MSQCGRIPRKEEEVEEEEAAKLHPLCTEYWDMNFLTLSSVESGLQPYKISALKFMSSETENDRLIREEGESQ